MNIVNAQGYGLGYCQQCDQPKPVGVYLLKGWQHTFRVCADCFRALAKEVSEKESSVVKNAKPK